jgi:Zn-dependent peptidase ImmA (M78 family)/transcriptional regulator with XRE-family HTH domain
MGMTQEELAKRLDLHQGSLSRMENGRVEPSCRTLYDLSRILEVSVDVILSGDRYILRDAVEPAGQPCRVDADDSTLTEGTLHTAQALIDAFMALEDICDAPKHAEIPLRLPVVMTEPGMEKLVRKVRDLMGIRDGVIFDYFELFETQGFRVVVLPLYHRIKSFAYYDPRNENAFFFINSRDNPEKQLFRLVYELGHIFIANDRTESGRQGPGTLDALHAARKFAALFLMPAQAVRNTVAQLGIRKRQWTYELLLRIKHRFGVSAEAFLFRLKELDLIDTDVEPGLRQRIREHYAQTDFEEPDASRRLLTPNGRLWDLVLTASFHGEYREELRQIEKLLIEERVVHV